MSAVVKSVLSILSRANTWLAAQVFNGEISVNGKAQVSQRIASAWVKFNGVGTVTIADSFNVSSVTDNGVGDYTVNYASSISVNAAVLTSSGQPLNTTFPSTADATQIQIRSSAAALTDSAQVSLMAMGD